MVCGSVLAVNEIVDFHRNNSNKDIVVTGVSLGGVITSLHYFYFCSANYYFPIIAYPDFGEILLSKNLKEFIANFELLKRNKSIIKSYRIPKRLEKKPQEKILPILAKEDELISYAKARKFWKGYSTKTLDIGHNTIVIKTDEIRKTILSKVFK